MDSTACLRPVGVAPHQSHFVAAAQAAESSGARQITGRAFPCSRGGGRVTPAQCLENFRSGDRPCVSPEHGRCTTGIIEDAKHSEDDMGKSNYGKCVLCGRTANRDSEGRCYHSKCKAARKAPVEHLVDPLEMRECPEPGRDEMPAAAAIQGDAEAVSGRGEPFEKIEELPGKDVQGAGALNASFDTPSQEQPAGNTGKGTCKVAGPCDDHISQPGKMVPGEKDSATLDTTRPFTLAGFDFEPDFYEPPAVPPTVRLSASGNLHFSSSAYATFGLRQFGFAKVLPDRSRQALCIVLSTTGGDGYHRLSTGSKCLRTPKVSVRHVFRGCPALVGKRMLLKETGVPGAFVAVLDGEAA